MHNLARRVDAAMAERGGSDDGVLEKRPPKEAVVVCLDVSASMSGLSGLATTEEDEDEEDDEDDDEVVPEEWWLWYEHLEADAPRMSPDELQERKEELALTVADATPKYQAAADAIRQLKGRFEGSLSATLGGRAVNVMGEALAAL